MDMMSQPSAEPLHCYRVTTLVQAVSSRQAMLIRTGKDYGEGKWISAVARWIESIVN